MSRLLKFDYRKRYTVEQALSHSFLKDVRCKELEKRNKKQRFEFEDIKLDLRTLQKLVVKEIKKIKKDFGRGRRGKPKDRVSKGVIC